MCVCAYIYIYICLPAVAGAVLQEPYTDGAFLRKHYTLTAALFPALRFVAPHLRSGAAVGEGRPARPLGPLVRVGFVSR